MSRDSEAWEEGPCDEEGWFEQRIPRVEAEIRALFAEMRAMLPNRGKEPWWEWPGVILLALALLAAAGLLMSLIPDSWYLSSHWPI